MEGYIHGKIYTQGRYTHEKAHVWKNTHRQTYTRGNIYTEKTYTQKGHRHGADVYIKKHTGKKLYRYIRAIVGSRSSQN